MVYEKLNSRNQGQPTLLQIWDVRKTCMNDTENSIVDSFRANGLSSLTLIQTRAIPILARKEKLSLVAPTGSGKTEASTIPIFYLISQNEQTIGSIKCIYVTPLRALNNDVLQKNNLLRQKQ